MNRIIIALFVLPLILIESGCHKEMVMQEPAGPDYAHKLAPGQSALRLITDPNRMPDLGAAYRERVTFQLQDSIDQSLSWFAKESSKQYFPFESITHDQARASLTAFSQLLQSSDNEAAFVADLKRDFNIYESVGYNGEGVVLFTGYYSPIFNASRARTDKYQYPLYKRPADLASDPKTGQPLGRKLPNGNTVPYYSRREIEQANMFKGTELVWLEDALSAFIIQVNGSAKLHMDDGKIMYVGYAGKTDRPYVGLGQSMLDSGMIKPNELSLKAIRIKFRENPQQVIELMNRNESYVFFTEYPGDKWPAGSLGVKVTEETTLATDKKIYPRGGLVMVDTQAISFDMGKKHFQRYMLDQDTGGAIQAPGRADIFMGIGPSAEILAGGQYAEGRLYYFFLKPEFVGQYGPKQPIAPRAKGVGNK